MSSNRPYYFKNVYSTLKDFIEQGSPLGDCAKLDLCKIIEDLEGICCKVENLNISDHKSRIWANVMRGIEQKNQAIRSCLKFISQQNGKNLFDGKDNRSV